MELIKTVDNNPFWTTSKLEIKKGNTSYRMIVNSMRVYTVDPGLGGQQLTCKSKDAATNRAQYDIGIPDTMLWVNLCAGVTTESAPNLGDINWYTTASSRYMSVSGFLDFPYTRRYTYDVNPVLFTGLQIESLAADKTTIFDGDTDRNIWIVYNVSRSTNSNISVKKTCKLTLTSLGSLSYEWL